MSTGEERKEDLLNTLAGLRHNTEIATALYTEDEYIYSPRAVRALIDLFEDVLRLDGFL